jgi:hypothetical protein
MTSNSLSTRRGIVPRPKHCPPPPPPPPPPPGPPDVTGSFDLEVPYEPEDPAPNDPVEVWLTHCRDPQGTWDIPTLVWTLLPQASMSHSTTLECPEDVNAFYYYGAPSPDSQRIQATLIYSDGGVKVLSATVEYPPQEEEEDEE